jgi:hypothetical protein
MTQNLLIPKAQAQMYSLLTAGDYAIDATAGNGHDTLFLAKCLHPGGRLWAIDIQAVAIEATRARLSEAGLLEGLTLLQANHAELLNLIPEACHGKIKVIVFNLGYLPGGNKACVTLPHSTLSGLSASLHLLAPGGLLSLMVYPGHKGGASEAQVILDWLTTLDAPYSYTIHPSKPLLEKVEGSKPAHKNPFLISERPYLHLSTKPFWISLYKDSAASC